jgi:undecaprenyl-diphosphatase
MDRLRTVARDPWTTVGVACVLGFLAVAAVVNGRPTVLADAPVIDVVRSLPIPIASWDAVTQAGGRLLIVVGAALVLGLIAVGRMRMALVVAVALVAATLFTDGMKDLVARPRPPDPVSGADGYSFPSGHALNSTVTYGIAALLAWRSAMPRRARFAVAAALVLLIALVGLSRIALGVHYPSDVVAGWLAGTAVVSVVAIVDAADRRARAAARAPRSARAPADRTG